MSQLRCSLLSTFAHDGCLRNSTHVANQLWKVDARYTQYVLRKLNTCCEYSIQAVCGSRQRWKLVISYRGLHAWRRYSTISRAHRLDKFHSNCLTIYYSLLIMRFDHSGNRLSEQSNSVQRTEVRTEMCNCGGTDFLVPTCTAVLYSTLLNE